MTNSQLAWASRRSLSAGHRLGRAIVAGCGTSRLDSPTRTSRQPSVRGDSCRSACSCVWLPAWTAALEAVPDNQLCAGGAL
jgi:hypothetical protein